MATRKPRMGREWGAVAQLGHAEGDGDELRLQLVSALGMALSITNRFWIGDRKVRSTKNNLSLEMDCDLRFGPFDYWKLLGLELS